MRNAIVAALVLAAATITISFGTSREHTWTPEQVAQLRSLSLDALEPLPADPSNRFADDARAVASWT